MPAPLSLKGIWSGRLVDCQGFAGRITITLRHDPRRGLVSGFFESEIPDEEEVVRRLGNVSGQVRRDRLTLEFRSGPKEGSAVVKAEGRLMRLREGGIGFKATYAVSAKTYAPLQGGILCAATGQPGTSVKVEAGRPEGRARDLQQARKAPARGAGRKKAGPRKSSRKKKTLRARRR